MTRSNIHVLDHVDGDHAYCKCGTSARVVRSGDDDRVVSLDEHVEHWARVFEWTAALRSGEFGQATSTLAVHNPGGKPDYCCLGVLCVKAGVPMETHEHDVANDEGVVEITEVTYYFAGDSELAPDEAVEWLGLQRVGGNADLTIVDLSDRQGDARCWTAAGLNDAGFTFDQIADMVEHFGVSL